MKLTTDIHDVLRRCSTAGNLLYLPGRLDDRLYKRVDAALSAAGARWDKEQQAHEFPGPAADAVVRLGALTEVTTAREHRQATQFFPTPDEVVEQLITIAALGPGLQLLEPSAGTGAIAAAAARIVAAVDCIEADAGYAASIQAAGYARTVTVADFLAVPPEPRYDRVVMNPPFAHGADVRHVRHALRFVKPGGRLIAVMSPGVTYRRDRATRELRALVEASGGWFDDLPAGAFAESGTPIKTVIAVIPVPGGPVIQTEIPGVGLVTWVSTDATGWRYPWFRPSAAAPGVYAHDDFGGRGRVFRFAGNCIGCGARTWAHDDGGDDPRGPFGFNLCTWLFREEFDDDSGVPDDARFPRCWACSQDDDRNQAAKGRALATLRPAPVPPPPRLPAPGERPVQLWLFGDEPTGQRRRRDRRAPSR